MNGNIESAIQQKLLEDRTQIYRLARIEAIVESQHDLIEHQAELTRQYRDNVCKPRGQAIDELRRFVYKAMGGIAVLIAVLQIFGSRIVAAVWR